MLAGASLALVHAAFSIHLSSDQIVSGTAINFLALGITGYFYIDTYGNEGTPGDCRRFPTHLDWLARSCQTARVLSRAVVRPAEPPRLARIGDRRPRLDHRLQDGDRARIRAVGEHPRAADTVGISVYATRYAAVVALLAAMGGVYLSLGFVGSFNENMTAGRGFIALAALIFGAWRPFGALGAALLRLRERCCAAARELEVGGGTLFQALPYVLTLIAVAGVIGRSIPPAAIGRPYRSSSGGPVRELERGLLRAHRLGGGRRSPRPSWRRSSTTSRRCSNRPCRSRPPSCSR